MKEGKISLDPHRHRQYVCVRACACVRACVSKRLIQQVLWSDSHSDQLSDEGRAAVAHTEPDLGLPET